MVIEDVLASVPLCTILCGVGVIRSTCGISTADVAGGREEDDEFWRRQQERSKGRHEQYQKRMEARAAAKERARVKMEQAKKQREVGVCCRCCGRYPPFFETLNKSGSYVEGRGMVFDPPMTP